MVAQIIDYVKEVARWTYEELVAAVREARDSTADDPLVELFDGNPEFDKGLFIDRVARNLRRGRFLLPFVGDGIREDVERMAEFLQQAPQFGFWLGNMSWRSSDSTLSVTEHCWWTPIVVARTREITRAIIEVRSELKPGDVTITLPPDEPKAAAGKGRIARDDYLEQLDKNAG